MLTELSPQALLLDTRSRIKHAKTDVSDCIPQGPQGPTGLTGLTESTVGLNPESTEVYKKDALEFFSMLDDIMDMMDSELGASLSRFSLSLTWIPSSESVGSVDIDGYV